jgi:hypothetical protein
LRLQRESALAPTPQLFGFFPSEGYFTASLSLKIVEPTPVSALSPPLPVL